MQRVEETAATEKYGKLGPTLYEYLQKATEDEPISISIWYTIDIEQIRQEIIAKYPEAKLLGYQPSPETDLELYDKIFAEIIEAEQKAYEERANTVISQLEQQDVHVKSTVSLAPIIHTECTKEQILRLIESQDISSIHLDGKLELLLDNTTVVDRVPPVWARGITGSNVKVAVVEADGIYFGHSYLADGTYSNPSTPNIGAHATEMAGIIASTHSTYRGIAYGVPALYSANHIASTYTAAETATSAAVTANSNVLNFSQGSEEYGIINDFTKFIDHMAYNYLRTVVAAVGHDNISTNSVSNPSLGYNVIGVGGLTETGTPNWSDDKIWVFLSIFDIGSKWKNPQDGREKPEVVASADTVTTTDINNGFSAPCLFFEFFCSVGTSGATAQVSGVAALLMQRNATLKSWPQAVKSVIMASAVHNVETSNTEGGNPIVSDKDGIGGIDAALADTILLNNWLTNDTMPSGSGADSKTYNVNVVAGERVRVVLSWLSHTSLSSPRTDVLQTNLNLRIEDKDGVFVVDSLSTVDNFEAVEFVATKSGAYKFKVQRPSASSVQEAFSLAWAKQATYLPDIRNSNGWTSKIYVRNDDAEPRIARITFLNADGTYNSEINNTLDPAALWINSWLPPNWQGSAIVDGSEDLSVVVRNDAAGQANLDTGFLSAGVVDPAFAQPATPLYAPAIYINIFGGFNSAIYLQNPNKDATNVTLNFVGRTGYSDFSPSSFSIPANGSTGYFLSGAAWVGSLKITSGQPLAAKIIESQGSTVSRSYSATAAGKALMYVSAAYKNYFGFNSGLVIQNLHASNATNVTVTYCDRLFTSCVAEPVVNLAAQRAYGINIGATTVLPATWTGSAKIESTGSVPLAVAVTNSNSVGGYDVSATNMGSKIVILPRAARAAGGRTTGYTVRNVSGQNNVSVTAYYYNAGGGNSVWSRTFTLNAGQVDGYFQSNDAGISNGWEGSIVLEATQPIIAIMREDTASTTSGYNGIPR